MHLWQEAGVPVRMGSTDSEQPFSRLENEAERNVLSVIVKLSSERFIKLTAERDDVLLWLKNFKV